MNAQTLYENIKNTWQNVPISNTLRDTYNHASVPKDWELNQNANLIDMANTQNAQNYFYWNRNLMHSEAMANTAVQRRMLDLYRAGINPYLAAASLGAPVGNEGFPSSAMNLSQNQSKNESSKPWGQLLASGGMSIFNGIIQAAMNAFSMYLMKKALDNKDNGDIGTKWNGSGKFGPDKLSEEMGNGARGLADGLKNITKMIPPLFGLPNFNLN